MRIACIGGGPAGLYFSILMKKAFPESRITVYERNKPADTFGWGVVFSDETLDNFKSADPESYADIQKSFATWTDIENHHAETCVRSTGHGFCGLSRKRLLQILHARARELGVELLFEREIRDDSEVGRADLIVASDGINSLIRQKYAAQFRPALDWRKCKFAWFGTTKPLRAFTFVFKQSPYGLFQVHAYPFQGGEEPLSTWIVECHEEVWKRAGLDRLSEAQSLAFVEELFADHLGGHPLLTNKSVWRSFPTVRCATWHYENLVLVGDAAHTAHFSIGSGTKLAMEDAIALVDAFRELGLEDVPPVLARYEEERRTVVDRLQKAAQTSLEWFENSARYVQQHPLPFMFNLMTRSKRITYEKLRLRDPELVRRVAEWVAEESEASRDAQGKPPAPLFVPFRLRGLELANRVVVAPMCEYSAGDGTVGDGLLVQLDARAINGAALVLTHATQACADNWSVEHERAWKRVVDLVRARSSARTGILLAHAGIEELDRAGRDKVLADFVAATGCAERAGFDLLELHLARLPLEVFDAARAAWPEEKPIAVRMSAHDPLEDAGRAIEESVETLRTLRGHGLDLVGVSAGHTTESESEQGRLDQISIAERIRYEVGIPVLVLGGIQGPDQANTLIAAGRADLCALATSGAFSR